MQVTHKTLDRSNCQDGVESYDNGRKNCLHRNVDHLLLDRRPSGDLIVAAWQKTTMDWWETQQSRFDVYVSDVSACAAKGYTCPEICTPQELMGVVKDGG